MPKPFNFGELEARTGRSVSLKARWRVEHAVPEYFEWPRRLRQIYIMLSTHGSSDAAINAVIGDFGWDKAETWEMIGGEHNFLERVIEFREKGEYPRGFKRGGKTWRSPLTAEHLAIVFAEEARFEALAKLMNSDGKGAGVSQHLRLMVENAGFFNATDSVLNKPAIELDGGGKPSGMVIDPEDAAEIRDGERVGQSEASLVEDWDWEMPEEEQEIDALYAAPEAERDAPVEGEGEVGAGRTERREDQRGAAGRPAEDR